MTCTTGRSILLTQMQDIQDECGRVAQELRMQVPLQVSSQTDDSSPVFSALVTAALTPTKFIPETPTLRVSNSSSPGIHYTFIAFSSLHSYVCVCACYNLTCTCFLVVQHHITPHHTTPHHTTPHHTVSNITSYVTLCQHIVSIIVFILL